MITALVLIDIQNDYFPGGSYEIDGIEEASMNAAKLLKFARDIGLPIFHIQHYVDSPSASSFAIGSEGVKIHKSVMPAKGETIIKKTKPNSFHKTNLYDKLAEKSVDKLIIVGAMSHNCIDSTVRAASDLSFDCIVVHDACATKDLSFSGKLISANEVNNTFMAALHGGYAEVMSSNDLLQNQFDIGIYK